MPAKNANNGFTDTYTFLEMTKRYGKYKNADGMSYYVPLARMTTPPRKELKITEQFGEETA